MRMTAISSVMAMTLLACMGPDNSTPKQMDYFSGTWESDINGGRIRLAFLPQGKLRIQWLGGPARGDSIFSDLIYRYRVQKDSAIIEETLDSVVTHPFALTPGTIGYLYYKPLGDTLLLGSTMPPRVDWISQDANRNQELFGSWSAPLSGTLSMVIRADSTGTLGNQSGHFRISRDLFIFQEASEDIGGVAFYYEIAEGKMRTWRAKFDCSQTNCSVEDRFYFRHVE